MTADTCAAVLALSLVVGFLVLGHFVVLMDMERGRRRRRRRRR